ncbi:uncharacterized protein EI90DRAFT_3131700 [Cantharellus anzutake]|uniref:uncharacterized protein n=1 Tax=Cantharellus anzutake TaxID=1750568 RepID=UPI001907F6E9|nr:uncharacterized protein EI90DRAFT_3131700 [Cantharellus anzutake]KAF8321436.1 hypothetical protein EI90DRAFT_3131700 [Cantharellus anzutake]
MESFVSARPIQECLEKFPHVKVADDGDLLIPTELSEKFFQILDTEERASMPRPVNVPTSPLPPLPCPPLPSNNICHQLSAIHTETRVTRKLHANYLIDWPLEAIVEYPRTTDSPNERILHIFRVDPTSPVLPQHNFLYGFGSPCGMHENVQCYALKGQSGVYPRCREQHLTCQGMKVCEFSNLELQSIPHSLACHDDVSARACDEHHLHYGNPSAAKHLQQATLAKYTALQKMGCPSPQDLETIMTDTEWDALNEKLCNNLESRRGWDHCNSRCSGRLVLEMDYEDPLHRGSLCVRCEHFSALHRSHFEEVIVGVNAEYFEALWFDDEETVKEIECMSNSQGWGPDAMCLTIENSSSTQTHCTVDHHLPNNRRGKLKQITCTCIM